eukprot:75794-Karenia_brevis.AAC.1
MSLGVDIFAFDFERYPIFVTGTRFGTVIAHTCLRIFLASANHSWRSSMWEAASPGLMSSSESSLVVFVGDP